MMKKEKTHGVVCVVLGDEPTINVFCEEFVKTLPFQIERPKLKSDHKII